MSIVCPSVSQSEQARGLTGGVFIGGSNVIKWGLFRNPKIRLLRGKNIFVLHIRSIFV